MNFIYFNSQICLLVMVDMRMNVALLRIFVVICLFLYSIYACVFLLSNKLKHYLVSVQVLSDQLNTRRQDCLTGKFIVVALCRINCLFITGVANLLTDIQHCSSISHCAFIC